MNQSKALSHGHLNKLTKIRSQISAQAKKISTLDKEWENSVQRTMEKINNHALLYQQCRGEMLEAYNLKLADLRKLKYELNLALQSLPDRAHRCRGTIRSNEGNHGECGVCSTHGQSDLIEEEEPMEIHDDPEEEAVKDGKDAKVGI